MIKLIRYNVSNSLNYISKRSLVTPPTFFKDLNDPPKPHEDWKQHQNHTQFTPNNDTRNLTWFMTIISLGILGTSTYIIINQMDKNFKLHREVSIGLINLHKLTNKCRNVVDETKTKDSNLLNKTISENELNNFKMLIHILMLRKQLHEKGIEPIEIDQLVLVFEKDVKSSVSNSKLSLWLLDDSDLKRYLPNSKDYDNK